MFLSLYEQLFWKALRIRLVEENIEALYPTDCIQSPVHLSNGQEAISVGVCQHLLDSDLVFGTYRSHALYLAKGGSLKKMYAELFGKVSGCGKGKAGSMHLCDPAVGMMGTSAIVASTISNAVGAAYAAKMQNKKQLIVCFFGEGATGAGVYHESLNFASIFQLPILFICENNDLSIYSCSSELRSFDIKQHALTYGIASYDIENGYDLAYIAEKAHELIAQIKLDSFPRLLEIKTFRYRQHVGPGEDFHIGYRSEQEMIAWGKNDPLLQNKELLDKFKLPIMHEIEEALNFAKQSSFPEMEELTRDVY